MSSFACPLDPAQAPCLNPGYVVEWRRGAGGPWFLLVGVVSREEVVSALASPAAALTLGDLVRVRDAEGRTVAFSVQADEGLVALPAGSDRSLAEAMRNAEMAAWCRASGYDWERAWDECQDATWLLHLAGWAGVDRRLLVHAACDCAETALRYVPQGEARPRVALETARRWAEGQASGEELAAAGDAAGAAAVAAAGEASGAAWNAALAASGAAAVASAGDAAWDAAGAADSAGYAAGNAVGNAAWDAAMASTLATLAPLVRQRLPLWRVALAMVARGAE